MLGYGADRYSKRWFGGHHMLWWQVLAMTQQVERRAWLPMVMISSAVLNKEEEE
jgi:hypothetical protein